MRCAPRVVLAVVVTAAVVPLAGCGSAKDHTAGGHAPSAAQSHAASGSSAQPSADHNQADVTFATGMIPHHGQAITMADMAGEQASSSQVKQVAAEIKAAQGPEITALSGWLKAWARPSRRLPCPAMTCPAMTPAAMG